MTLIELVAQDVPPQRIGKEYRGACPKCGGGAHSDRFIIWPDEDGGKGRYWCRQCHISGNSIQYLRDIRGLSITEAKRVVGGSLPVPRLSVVSRTDRDAELRAFWEWKRAKRRRLTEIGEEIEIAEIAYRAICRVPAIWPEDEQDFWIHRLGGLSLALDVVREETDALMDNAIAWQQWQEER